MDLREIGWRGGRVYSDRDQWQTLVNTVMNLQVLAPWSSLVS
jgi:hypothetical protein